MVLLIGAALVIAGKFAYDGIVWLGQTDAFASLKKSKSAGLRAGIDIRLSGVNLRHYENGSLKMRANLDSVEVSQGREVFQLSGVKQGWITTQKGPLNFEGKQGTWNSRAQRLTVDEAVRVRNGDLDLRSARLEVNRPKSILKVPAPLQGKLFGGAMQASSFQLNLGNGDLDMNDIRWQGELKQLPGTPDDLGTSRTWKLSGSMKKRGVKEITRNGKAEDGEVLIIAPVLERDTKTDVLVATGRVTYFSGKLNAVADKVTVYRKEKRAIFEGKVILFVKSKKDQNAPPKEEEVKPLRPILPSEIASKAGFPALTEVEKQKDSELRSARNVRDNPLTFASDRIEYWYEKGKRRAVITGDPQAHQEFADGRWRHAWTYRAEYNAEAEKLKLLSQPGRRDARMVNSIGDDMMAVSLLVSTKEDQTEEQEEVDGEDVVALVVSRDPDEDPRGAKKPERPAMDSPRPKVNPPSGRRASER